MQPLTDLVVKAQGGDVEAYARLVEATQRMVQGVAFSVLRDSTAAQDAAQQAYLRAFRRLRDLEEPVAFAAWLRRIVITVALNMRRARRLTFVTLDDIPDVPVLDESETRWSEAQRHRLASALLSLTPEERQLCDRRYHGQWTTARLAAHAGVDEAAMRKRLQRIRDKLRKEMEVSEQRGIRPEDLRQDLPARVVELLAHPRLTDLPENPVGKTLETLRSVYAEFTEASLPEVVDHQMCSQAWEIEIDDDGQWFEVLAWGVFSDRIVRHLGGDPERHIAVGVGYGLERLAMLRYGIDDIRRIEVASVA